MSVLILLLPLILNLMILLRLTGFLLAIFVHLPKSVLNSVVVVVVWVWSVKRRVYI